MGWVRVFVFSLFLFFSFGARDDPLLKDAWNLHSIKSEYKGSSYLFFSFPKICFWSNKNILFSQPIKPNSMIFFLFFFFISSCFVLFCFVLLFVIIGHMSILDSWNLGFTGYGFSSFSLSFLSFSFAHFKIGVLVAFSNRRPSLKHQEFLGRFSETVCFFQ